VGKNEIEFETVLSMRDLCTPARADLAWLRISSNSLLHLPLESVVGGSMLPITFEDFPAIFHSGSGLNQVAMIVAPEDFAMIQAAAKLAGTLGASLPQNTLVQLLTLTPESVNLTEIEDKSLLLIGTPSDFDILTSNFPSLIFNDQNVLDQKSVIELVNRPGADADMGYLAIRGFNAASSKVLLAVLGNKAEGVLHAVEKLTANKAGENNILIVSGAGEQMGWYDEGIATGEVSAPQIEATSEAEIVNPVQAFKAGLYAWAVPVLAVLLAIALLFLYIEIRQSIKKQ